MQGEIICRPRRDDAQLHIGMCQLVDDSVHGPITAHRDHRLDAGLDGLAHRADQILAGGRHEDLYPEFAQLKPDLLQQGFSRAIACARITDDQDPRRGQRCHVRTWVHTGE